MLPGGEVSKKRETLCKALWKLAMAKCLKQSKLVNSKVWTSAPCQVRKRIDAPFNTDEADLATLCHFIHCNYIAWTPEPRSPLERG